MLITLIITIWKGTSSSSISAFEMVWRLLSLPPGHPLLAPFYVCFCYHSAWKCISKEYMQSRVIHGNTVQIVKVMGSLTLIPTQSWFRDPCLLQKQGAQDGVIGVFILPDDSSQVALQKSLGLVQESLETWNPEEKNIYATSEEILSADLSVLLSYVVWLRQQSGTEIDDLQSFLNSEVRQCWALS